MDVIVQETNKVMNKKEYINIIKDCYKEYQSKEMCLGYAQIIYDHLMSLRYVKDEFMSYPKSVLEDLFKEDNLFKRSMSVFNI